MCHYPFSPFVKICCFCFCFCLQWEKTSMVNNVKDAPQIEAISTAQNFLGSWWPAHVLGSWNEFALVRFVGYKSEDDEWLPLTNIRLPTTMLDRCSDIVIGKRYEVFCSSQDWRDAMIRQIHLSKDCSNDDKCDACEVTVQYDDTAGSWAGIKERIGPILDRVSQIATTFDDEMAQANAVGQPKTSSAPPSSTDVSESEAAAISNDTNTIHAPSPAVHETPSESPVDKKKTERKRKRASQSSSRKKKPNSATSDQTTKSKSLPQANIEEQISISPSKTDSSSPAASEACDRPQHVLPLGKLKQLTLSFKRNRTNESQTMHDHCKTSSNLAAAGESAEDSDTLDIDAYEADVTIITDGFAEHAHAVPAVQSEESCISDEDAGHAINGRDIETVVVEADDVENQSGVEDNIDKNDEVRVVNKNGRVHFLPEVIGEVDGDVSGECEADRTATSSSSESGDDELTPKKKKQNKQTLEGESCFITQVIVEIPDLNDASKRAPKRIK
jgi:hypothetical protein